jgi:prevent-host-death family protein
MPIIKPISDLRNKTNHVSDLLHKSHEPVFITRNGEGDMVLMSLAKYNTERWNGRWSAMKNRQSQTRKKQHGRPRT